MTASVLQERNSVSNTAGTTISLAFTSNVTVGSAIHAIGAGGVNSTYSFGDNNGSATYTALDTQFNANGVGLGHAYTANHAAGSTTVTLTIGASSASQSIWIREIGGVTIAPIDGHNENNNTGSASITTSATNTVQPAFISALGFSAASQTQTATNGLIQDVMGGIGGPGASYHLRITTAASQTGGFTVPSSADLLFIAMAIFNELVPSPTATIAWVS